MSTVLITGVTGFVGRRLLPRLLEQHEVVAISRSAVEVDGISAVRGDFASLEDLRRLDRLEFDTVLHLAAVLDDATEEECLAVNVVGTANLLRYAVDRGCEHFVLASSVAATGCMSDRFLPRELPIGDDHPHEGFDPYGMSKALMEEHAFYLQRRQPDLEIALIRIGGVVDDGEELEDPIQALRTEMPFLFGGLVHSDRLVEDLALATGRRLGPGVRRFNSVDPQLSGTPLNVAEELGEALGERAEQVDTSHYEEPGRERASYYASDRLRNAYEGQKEARGQENARSN